MRMCKQHDVIASKEDTVSPPFLSTPWTLRAGLLQLLLGCRWWPWPDLLVSFQALEVWLAAAALAKDTTTILDDGDLPPTDNADRPTPTYASFLHRLTTYFAQVPTRTAVSAFLLRT
jgi:hypothetical protein